MLLALKLIPLLLSLPSPSHRSPNSILFEFSYLQLQHPQLVCESVSENKTKQRSLLCLTALICSAPMSLLTSNPNPNPNDNAKKTQRTDLGNGSEVVYVPRVVAYDDAWKFFNYLDNHIPWTRPTLRVFGRSCLQPRDTCYVASAGLPDLIYSGYQPHAYSWDDFPPLKEILDTVHKMLPGSRFNSLLLNRYKGGNDYVGWHADDEKLYGSTPEIASVSFGCEREFFLKKKCRKSSQSQERSDEKPPLKRIKRSRHEDQHCFTLKHGSVLVMRGYTQRDWLHSVPKRAKAETTRINLTFRLVL